MDIAVQRADLAGLREKPPRRLGGPRQHATLRRRRGPERREPRLERNQVRQRRVARRMQLGDHGTDDMRRLVVAAVPGVIGKRRGFDYANLFCNPDLSDPEPAVATRRDRFLARLAIVTARSGIERERMLAWILAWCGLSAAWFLADGDSAEIDLRVAALALALAEIDR